MSQIRNTSTNWTVFLSQKIRSKKIILDPFWLSFHVMVWNEEFILPCCHTTGVVGRPMRSKAGELSLLCSSLTLLAPCLHQLPKTPIESHQKRFRYLSDPLGLISTELTMSGFWLIPLSYAGFGFRNIQILTFLSKILKISESSIFYYFMNFNDLYWYLFFDIFFLMATIHKCPGRIRIRNRY